MSTQYGFSFIKEKCIQCFGCEVACKTWREIELGVRWIKVHNIWYGRFPNIKNVSLSIACLHCVDPLCIKACPVGAIKKRIEDGVVFVDKNKCTGCKTCLNECPFGVPQFGTDGKMQICDMCMNELDLNKGLPPCVETCPTKALNLSKMDIKKKIEIEQEVKKLLSL